MKRKPRNVEFNTIRRLLPNWYLVRSNRGQERKLRSFLAENNLGNELTNEASEREGLRRKGQTYKPNPVLEKQRQKKTN